jgi:geranylgeranyl pyrophosphate synthase
MQYISSPTIIGGSDLINEKLNLVEEILLAEQSGQPSLLSDAAIQLLQAGGKRIRAAISLLSSAVFDEDLDNSLSLAAGVEMLHTATLVHDDIIDDSVQRRGKPTLNASLDAKLSVLIGDYFFARAANLVAETNNLDIMKQFSGTLMIILSGEVNQQLTRWQIDRQTYFDRVYAKTGAMFVLAAKSAATLANADKKSLRAMEKYGRYTGIAFQIVDDVLDFTGRQDRLGKPVGSDLREGIFTLPVLLYVDQYPDDQLFSFIQESQNGNHPAIDELISDIRNSGVTDQALAEAADLIARGQQALIDVPYSPYIDALSSLGDTVVSRFT